LMSGIGGPETASSASAGFPRLVELEIPFLQRSARRFCRDPADAADLVQETLLRALSSAHLWEANSNLRAWLFTIMRNEFLTSAAAASRRGKALTMAINLATGVMAEEQSIALEIGEMRTALGRLSTKQRLAVLLVAVEGRSYEEVALSMRTTIGAVRSHLARGRERLRELASHASGNRPLWSAQVRKAALERPSRTQLQVSLRS